MADKRHFCHTLLGKREGKEKWERMTISTDGDEAPVDTLGFEKWTELILRPPSSNIWLFDLTHCCG